MKAIVRRDSGDGLWYVRIYKDGIECLGFAYFSGKEDNATAVAEFINEQHSLSNELILELGRD